MIVSEPDLNSCPDQDCSISLDEWPLEGIEMAYQNSGDVFFRCVHALEFMVWLIELDKYMIQSRIMFH